MCIYIYIYIYIIFPHLAIYAFLMQELICYLRMKYRVELCCNVTQS